MSLRTRLDDHPRLLAGVVLALGAALTGLATERQVAANAETAGTRFRELAEGPVTRLAERMRSYEYALLAARSTVLAEDPSTMTRARFERSNRARDIGREFPGARTVTVIWRVPAPDEPAFLAAARQDVSPRFAIRQLAAHPGDRYVLTYAAPMTIASIGTDLASEPTRRRALEAGLRSGRATISAPLALFESLDGARHDLLLSLPIYRPDLPTATEAERVAASIGWAGMPLEINKLLASVGLDDNRLTLALDDPGDDLGAFYSTAGAADAATGGLVERIELPVYGRTWVVEMRARPLFLAELGLPDPRAVGAAGAALTFLSSWLAWSLAQNALRQQRLRDEQARGARELREANATLETRVAERTALLESARQQLQTIIDAMPSTIAYWDRGGLNRFANRAYREWLGVDPKALQGKPMAAALGEELYERNRLHVEAALRGEAQSFERTLPRLDGSGVRHVLAHYLPDSVDGRIEGFYVFVNDVSEVVEGRQRLAAAQRETQALLATMNLHTIVSVADRSGRIVDVNDGFCRISGYGREELLGQYHRILDSGVQGPDFWADMWRSITAGRPWRGEICNRAKDGTLHWVDSIIAPFAGADGSIEKFISIRFDVTAAKRAEQALRASQSFLDRAGKIAGVGGWELDLRSGLMTWTTETFRIHGLPVGAPPGWASALGFFVPQARPLIEAAARRAAADGTPWDLELGLVSAAGRELWVRVQGTADLEGGRAIRLVGALQDITERKRSQAELIETASLLDTVLTSASEVAIIAAGPGHRISVFNLGAQRMLGYRADEVIGQATSMLVHDPEEVAQRSAELAREIGRPVANADLFSHASTLGQSREWTYVRKDGSRLQVALVVTEMRTADGRVLGFLGVAHDVTVRKEQEASLRLAMHRADRANAAKSQFLTNMSHEIRTPMNAVIGLSYLLAQSALDAEQSDTVGKLRIAAKSLLAVIDDVLDLSKIEAGEWQLERLPFSLRTLLAELAGLMSVQAQAKGIGFSIAASPDLPPALLGDASRLGQVLANLVANAIKFTDRGEVALSVRRIEAPQAEAGEPAALLRLRFEVRDSGIGIAPAVQQRLFSPFTQADASTKRRFGGTGLGLSIVKRVVTALGGEVGLQSEVGRGSTFWVELPFEVAEDEAVSRPLPLEWRTGGMLRGLRLLVADDSDINREVARRILELEGAEVALAVNGQEAVDRLRAEPGGFDVVLMDVQMPVLDGHEATHCIRRELGLARLPVIALTAGALADERQRALAAGMNGFVTKPFDAKSLVRTLLRHAGARPAAAAGDLQDSDAEAMPGDRRGHDGVDRPAADPGAGTAPGRGDGAGIADPQEAWPPIDGIDDEAVRRRLGGDLALFRSMVKRLLGEFGDLGAAGRGGLAAEADLPALAGRMHKLLGGASTLGARAIAQVAGQAEAAARRQDRAALPPLLDRLAVAIDRLQGCCADALREGEPAAIGPSAVEPEAQVDPDGLAQLRRLLGQQSMEALGCFHGLSAQLRRRLGSHDYRQVDACMENLEFADAARLLSTL